MNSRTEEYSEKSITIEDSASVELDPLAHSSISGATPENDVNDNVSSTDEEKYFIPLVEPGGKRYIAIMDLLDVTL